MPVRHFEARSVLTSLAAYRSEKVLTCEETRHSTTLQYSLRENIIVCTLHLAITRCTHVALLASKITRSLTKIKATIILASQSEFSLVQLRNGFE